MFEKKTKENSMKTSTSASSIDHKNGSACPGISSFSWRSTKHIKVESGSGSKDKGCLNSNDRELKGELSSHNRSVTSSPTEMNLKIITSKRSPQFFTKRIYMKLMLNLVVLLILFIGSNEVYSGERRPSYSCVPVRKDEVNKDIRKKRKPANREVVSKVVYAHFNVKLCKGKK
jgi:hypothetical protein